MLALRREIADLTSLLAALEHYRHEKIDITSYMPAAHPRNDNAAFLHSLAKTLSTVDKAVVVTGGLVQSNHLELVIAVEDDHSAERCPSRSDSEDTLIGVLDSKELIKETPAEHEAITHFIKTHFSFERMSQPHARHLLLKEQSAEVRQKIVSSDFLFPYHTSGFREIFCAWSGSDSTRDYTLLPKEGIIHPIKSSMASFISQIVAGVWNKKAGTVSFTNANLPRWINGMGLLLGYVYLAFGNPTAAAKDLFFLIEALYVFKGFIEMAHMKRVFTRSSLALALKTCYVTAHTIGPYDHAVHDYYPLPSCTQRLVVNYLSGIIEVASHSKSLYHHRQYLKSSLPPSIDIENLTVDVVYLQTKDPLSHPPSSLEETLLTYIPDIEEDENWFNARRDLLRSRIPASIHPEAAVICMKREPKAFADEHDLVSRAAHTRHIGSSRKMCYCCAIVDAWTKHEAGIRVERMDPHRCHGRILPWLPPRYGLSQERLESLRIDLIATLEALVTKLRRDDRALLMHDVDF